jgi:translation initiation factor IF-3
LGKFIRSTKVERNLRINERIRISPILLVDENNNQVGTVDTRDALARARQAGLDLVEVAPQSRPPVCRIMDYGKWKYGQRKKEQKAKAHRHDTELKQVRIRTPKIGDHDLEIKVQMARGFLSRGDRVQFSLMFRGRELAHIEEGRKVFTRIAEELSDVGKVDMHVRREGRRITMSLSSLGKAAPAQPKPAPSKPAPSGSAPPGTRPVPSGPVPSGPVPSGPVPSGPVPEGPAPSGPAPEGTSAAPSTPARQDYPSATAADESTEPAPTEGKTPADSPPASA